MQDEVYCIIILYLYFLNYCICTCSFDFRGTSVWWCIYDNINSIILKKKEKNVFQKSRPDSVIPPHWNLNLPTTEQCIFHSAVLLIKRITNTVCSIFELVYDQRRLNSYYTLEPISFPSILRL